MINMSLNEILAYFFRIFRSFAFISIKSSFSFEKTNSNMTLHRSKLKYAFYFFTFLIYISDIDLYGQSSVKVKTSVSVDRFMEKFVLNGKANETIKAWRIQIITTDDRREMESAKSNFSSMYPGMNVDWKHVAPYYQVRVGYFENKNKLMPFLLELKKTFPAATPVYDNVSKRALVSN